ncbi:MAG TPA: hypothetical protein VKV30_16505 [Candidatus Angelobacter sp.]|nr:hypothetical protein [Candidatus Angelobacter sp.]
MNRIREVLRNEYIGAVAIGFLLAQLIVIVISLIMRPINFYLERAASPTSVFGHSKTDTFPWSSLIGPVINMLLLGLISFLFLRFLYLKPTGDKADKGAPGVSAETQQDSDSVP